MQPIITAKDFSLTPSIKQYVTDHAEKLGKFRPDIGTTRFLLNVDRHHNKGETNTAEAWAEVAGAPTFYASATGLTMQQAVDEAVKKLRTQLEKDKEKLIDRHQRDRNGAKN